MRTKTKDLNSGWSTIFTCDIALQTRLSNASSQAWKRLDSRWCGVALTMAGRVVWLVTGAAVEDNSTTSDTTLAYLFLWVVHKWYVRFVVLRQYVTLASPIRHLTHTSITNTTLNSLNTSITNTTLNSLNTSITNTTLNSLNTSITNTTLNSAFVRDLSNLAHFKPKQISKLDSLHWKELQDDCSRN